MTNRVDPELYAAMCQPRSHDAAQKALADFDRELYDLRKKYGISNVLYVAAASVEVEKEDGAKRGVGAIATVCHVGDSANALPMAATAFRHFRGEQDRAALAMAGIKARKAKKKAKGTADVAKPGAEFQEANDAFGRYMDVTVGAATQRFRFIQAGTFTMGSPESERGRYDDEVQHEVTITRGYWLADAPVTQAFYEAVNGSNPSRFKGATLPVECVSYDDALAFIAKLNALVPGLDARLPTEAEWEMACRGGTTTATYRGELEDTIRAVVLSDIAWYYGNADGKTHPVKTKAPNALGLYDTLGDVWEWCQDWHGPYTAGKAIDPKGPSTGVCRVLRGGSWFSGAGGVRAAFRSAGVPGCRRGGVGFRLARGQ